MINLRVMGYNYYWQLYYYYWIKDLYAMSNPYLLLTFSSELRGYFVEMLTCGKVKAPIDSFATKSLTRKA